MALPALPDQYMILSLPNSGTDWLCGILVKHGKGLRYFDKEFFNPICNTKYRHVLEVAFGCEMVSCYRNIGVLVNGPSPQLEAIYQGTWPHSGCNFDKENFAAFKVGFFAEHFQVAFLLRPAESIFPPGRCRVWAWYDAIWNALADAGYVERQAMALECRAREAHRVCAAELKLWAKCLGAPVFDYDLLGTAGLSEVESHLARGWVGNMVDVRSAAAEVVATRRHRDKTLAPHSQGADSAGSPVYPRQGGLP